MTTQILVAPDVGWVALPHAAPGAAEGFAVAALPLGPPLVLSGSAGAIWSALTRASTLEDILEDLIAQGLDLPDEAAAHVETFVQQLASAGLVHLSEAPRPSDAHDVRST